MVDGGREPPEGVRDRAQVRPCTDSCMDGSMYCSTSWPGIGARHVHVHWERSEHPGMGRARPPAQSIETRM